MSAKMDALGLLKILIPSLLLSKKFKQIFMIFCSCSSPSRHDYFCKEKTVAVFNV